MTTESGLRLEIKKFIKQMSIFDWLAAFVGAFSIFSMFQELRQFGVSEVIADFVGYYRTLARWAFGWLGWPFAWRLNPAACDLLALQFLCSGILLRSGAIRDLLTRFPQGGEFRPAGKLTKALVLLTPLSILTCYSSVSPASVFVSEESMALPRQVRPFVFRSVVALLIIFAINAYGLTVETE